MNTFALYGVYFKQRLFDDKFEFRIGRLAAAQLLPRYPSWVCRSAARSTPIRFSLFTNAPLDFTAPAAYARWNPTAEKLRSGRHLSGQSETQQPGLSRGRLFLSAGRRDSHDDRVWLAA